ncbi:phospholipid-transporting ATPase ABCA3-like [Zophobas morio]|uniref:phospholipid-transporting ATPase ABCA3-like n=1 Tax=Zophobas morio TaxID=2755281 RepID=UPI003083BC80
MAKLLRKFALLMWKNWLVLKRHPWVLIGEIIYVLSVLVLIYLLRRDYSVSEQETYYGYPQELDWRSFTSSGCASGDSKQIAYSPTSPLLHRMMVSSCTRENLTILEFDTKAELSEKISTDNQFVAGLNVALEFSDNLRGINESKDVPDDVEVTIRLPHKIDISDKWYSDRLYSYVSNMWGSSGQYAYERKFLRLQSYIMFFLAHDVDYIENFPTDNTIVSVSFPRPAILYDEFFGEENLSEPTFIALIICLFVYNHLVTIKKVASEKEKQLKESMKIMGLPGWLQWLCWFLQALLFNTVYIVLLLCMYTYIDPPIFVYSNGCILFLFFFLYAFSLISLAFLISTLFAKANANVLIGCFILLIAIFAYYSMVNRPEEKGASAPIVLLTSLLPTSALGFGMQIIFIYERIQKGVNWHNVATKPIPLDVSLRDIMLMLLADAILYMCLALYIEIVFPGEYGVPQPWYFLCLRSTWTSKPTYLRRRQVEQSATSNRESFEQVAGNRPVGIQLVNLTKTFGSHQAIKNLNLEFYQGQLTVLVGHNGAGKTTTLNAITGMLPPSGGTVYVNGYDVRKNITKVRDGMGLCLEHNVLFDELTVTEHLLFFSKLKGLDGKEAVSDVDKYVKALQLEEKRNSYPRTLSGGMKRKVSVAAALCGPTKVVILDEPTKGMDPSSRREVWNLLQEIKGAISRPLCMWHWTLELC